LRAIQVDSARGAVTAPAWSRWFARLIQINKACDAAR